MNLDFEDRIKKIRPYLIEEIQAEAIRIYKYQFLQKNNRIPQEEEIDRYINLLIQDNEINIRADNTIQELLDLFNKQSKNKFLRIIANSTFLLSILNLAIWYLLKYFGIAAEEQIFHPANLINAFLVIIFVLIIYTVSLIKK